MTVASDPHWPASLAISAGSDQFTIVNRNESPGMWQSAFGMN
jgi:hypothetical protein